MISLVMQTLDNSITTFTKRGLLGRHLSSRQGHGQPNRRGSPSAMRRQGGWPTRSAGYRPARGARCSTFPTTAHFLGGCAILEPTPAAASSTPTTGSGYPTLSIVDGSSVSANLGVNLR